MNSGGCGDRIAQMPAIIYALKNFDIAISLYCPKYFMPLADHFLRNFDNRVEVKDLAETAGMKTAEVVFHSNTITTLRRHLVDYAFDIMNDNSTDVPLEAKNYPRLRLDEIDTVKFNLPVDYVVLTPGYTALVRKLPAETWADIASYITFKGISVVWLGAKTGTIGGGLAPNSKFDIVTPETGDIDLRDATTLLEAGKIMSLSRAVVGIDNGLLHLAATSDVPIVAGYSSVAPHTRLPYRKGHLGWNCAVVEPTSACKYIQTRSHYNYSVDYRECVCGTNACVNTLTADKFIEPLERLL